MLSGEGNAGEQWKTTIRLISKKATLHVQLTFFVHFFAVVLDDYNVKLPKTFLWRKCRTCSRSLFFHCRSFSSCIGGRQHFSFCHRCYKIFMLFFQQKNFSFVFYLSLQISVALFVVEFRSPAAFYLFFLSFSGSILQICGHDN